jgi:tetratricopeptide (TPR) repeat protein
MNGCYNYIMMCRDSKTTFFFVIFLLLSFSGLTSTGFAHSSHKEAARLLTQAKEYFANKDFRMARDLLLRAKELNKFHPGLSELEQEMMPEIQEITETLKMRASFFLQANNIEEARKVYIEVLTYIHDDEDAIRGLENIEAIKEKIESYKKQGIVVDSDTGRSFDVELYSTISYINRARAFYAQGNYEKAKEFVKQILEREPTYGPALELNEKIFFVERLQKNIDLAETAFLKGNLSEAVMELNELIKSSPGKLDYYLMRGKAQIRLERYNEGIDDLLLFYKKDKDPDKVFPYLSEAFYNTERYVLALAFSKHPNTQKAYKHWYFLLMSNIKGYPICYFLLIGTILALPFMFYYLFYAIETVFMRFSLGTFNKFIKVFINLTFFEPQNVIKDLTTVARDLNNPWFYYLTGIVLLKEGELEGAQRFLAFCLKRQNVKSRAYFFYGLIRKHLKNTSYPLDFEESLISGLNYLSLGWHPFFMKKIERSILDSYSYERSGNSYEDLAFKLMNHIT